MYRIFLMVAYFLTSSTAVCPLYCNCSYQIVNCSGLKLTKVPTDLEPHTQYLKLAYNELQSCSFLENPRELTTIDLSHNAIQTAYFSKYDNLKEINLSWNALTTISFNQIPNLKKLDLSNNALFSSAENLISSDLKYLDLSNNSIKNFLLDGNSNSYQLKTLILAHNPITSISRLVSESIETLDITGCNIPFLYTRDFKFLPNLIKLRASGNKNLKITLNGHDINIEEADFSYSAITHINISALKKLLSINISFNKINTIGDDSFYMNSQLSSLNISSNYVKKISRAAFMNNTQVKIFDVSHNLVNTVQWTDYLIGCQHFYASYNKIVSLTGIQLLKATDVDLSHNLINEVSINLSEVFPVIEVLNLKDNPIEFIAPLRSKSLQRLKLGNCKLRELKPHTFSGLVKLKLLDLEGNQLKKLSYLVLEKAVSLDKVLLGRNAWACDCSNAEFKDLYYYLFINKTLTDPNTLLCEQNRTWVEVCIPMKNPIQRPVGTQFDGNVFVWLGVFFLVALAAGLGLLYCKGRKKSELPEPPSSSSGHQHQQTLLRNSEIRRVHSAAEILLQRTTPESPPFQDYAPPSYEEAILMPPLTETERMTRSMEVFLDRSN